jgi:hypothetical protein
MSTRSLVSFLRVLVHLKGMRQQENDNYGFLSRFYLVLSIHHLKKNIHTHIHATHIHAHTQTWYCQIVLSIYETWVCVRAVTLTRYSLVYMCVSLSHTHTRTHTKLTQVLHLKLRAFLALHLESDLLRHLGLFVEHRLSLTTEA